MRGVLHSVPCKCSQTTVLVKDSKDLCWWAAKHRRASDVTGHAQNRADKLMSKLRISDENGCGTRGWTVLETTRTSTAPSE